MLDPHLNGPWRMLKVLYGVVPIVAGLDKFTNLLTDWTQYLSPLATQLVPVGAATFMHIAGVIEIAVGVLVLTRFTRVGAYIVSAWLVLIALNLVMLGSFYDVAVRDLAMAAGAFTLARMTEAREASHARVVTKNQVTTPRRSVTV